MANVKAYNCAIALATALSIGACSSKHSESRLEEIPEIQVATPVIDSIVMYKTYPGYAGAISSARIVGRVNGTLLTKQYSGGDLVKKGQVLYTIESAKYADAVNQAKAALNKAESDYQYASNQYNAMKKALESDAVAQIEVIQAKSNMEGALAAINTAKAALNTAITNLGYCTVKAPFTGHIDNGTTDPGNYINGEGSPFLLANLYDDSMISIEFAIEENQYEKIMGDIKTPIGHELYDSIPLSFTEPLARTYAGKLSYESPTVDKSTGTITLKVRTPNPDGEIRNGMYVNIHLPFGENDKAILVKDASIGTDQLGKYLYVVNDSGTVTYTPIKIGDIYNDSMRVVTEGINPDTRYVTSALLRVRDGMTVKPVLEK
ncbi:MAG: efflux RND transporter periplasmic adaptor subunit [Lachnospiraceae bacterium]|nr:efflux RND transporter periplasmic adaptor subunit [Lachnospiraceae bacterium]